jgi:hypothetical protein
LNEEHFILVKLISGEQVMAILEQETGTDIDIVFPLLIRLFPQFDGNGSREHVTATPFSHFADDAHLTINKNSIIFVKNLNPAMVPHYLRLVAQENDRVFLNQDKQEKTKLTWGDTAAGNKQINDKLKKLAEAIAGDSTEEEIKVLIEGNDTVH